MPIEIEKITIDKKPVLRNLLELYAYDFSEFDHADVSEYGLYGYERLDHYWTEAGRHPFFIRVDQRLAGFVLVREFEPPDSSGVFSIAEFFVVKKYRGKGVGKATVFKIFAMFPGQWQVAELESNRPAQLFWRKVISEYTAGRFEEITEKDWEGPIQRFNTKKQISF